MKIAVAIMLLPVFAACAGGPTMDASRVALDRSAKVFVQVEAGFADPYKVARTRARETSATRPERDRKLVDWEAAKQALYVVEAELHGLEAALDLQEAGEDAPWPVRVCSLAAALGALRAALRALEQRVPPALSGAEAALRAVLSACSGGS